MVMQLFDSSDSDNEELEKIEVDKEFARRYEHNKKREDLQRYEELNKKGLIPRRARPEADGDEDSSEESSSEEDDDVDLKKKDLEFFDALIKIRKQDPSLKEKDVKLFESESESDGEDGEEGEEGKKKKKKAMYLKDVVAKHLIEEGAEFSDKDDRNNKKKLAYDEEQEEIRKAFLEAVEGGEVEEDEGDLLKLKEKSGGDQDESDNEEFQKKLDEYFGEGRSEDVDENTVFLKDYFKNKMWLDKNSNDAAEAVGCEDLELLSEDEKEIEKQEEYEYRFQENPGDRVLGHAREVDGSVRKKVKARKEQRKHKEERMEIARLEREEELRHLKNLKKKEMDERVKKIMEIAGIGDDEVVPLSAKELEDEFDPEEYDRMMKKAFGNKYYDAEDAELDFGSDADEEKPDFDKEDELLGLPKDWDSCETGDGFLAARERSLKHKIESGDSDSDSDSDQEEGEAKEVSKEGKRKRKRKTALLEKAKEAMLEEYYKLDYEDTIGDLKTRFKYSKIKPNRFGLSAAEIFVTDDKELNKYVSLKQMAPYKDKEWKVPNSKRHQFKLMTQELLRGGGKLDRKKHGKKKRVKDDANKPTSSEATVEDGKVQSEQPAGDESNLSRQARRRHKQSKFKLENTRLGAYQKRESKPKRKQSTEN